MTRSGMRCPECGCGSAVMNGRTRHGAQSWRCKSCGRQFVREPRGRVAPEIQKVVDRMISKGMPPGDIAELVDVSKSWVYARRRSAAEAVEHDRA